MRTASTSKKRPFWEQLSLFDYGMVIGVQIALTICWLNRDAGLPVSSDMIQGLFTIVFLPVYLTFVNYSLILKYRKPALVIPAAGGIMLSCIVLSSLTHYVRWSYRAGHGFIPPLYTIDVISFEALTGMIAALIGIALLFWRVKSFYQRHAGIIEPKTMKRQTVKMED